MCRSNIKLYQIRNQRPKSKIVMRITKIESGEIMEHLLCCCCCACSLMICYFQLLIMFFLFLSSCHGKATEALYTL